MKMVMISIIMMIITDKFPPCPWWVFVMVGMCRKAMMMIMMMMMVSMMMMISMIMMMMMMKSAGSKRAEELARAAVEKEKVNMKMMRMVRISMII